MKRIGSKHCLMFLFVFSISLTLVAQNGETYRIGITTGAFVPQVSTEADFQILSFAAFNGKYFRLLQFYQIPPDSLRKAWETQGLKLTDYLPGKVYFAVINEQYNLLQIKPYVRSIIDVDKRFKLSDEIFNKAIPPSALENGNAKLVISYYDGLDVNKVKTDLETKGITVAKVRTYSRQMDIRVAVDRLDEIVALPYIQFVGPQSGEPSLEENEFRNSSGRSNYINTGYNGLNFNGQGETVAIGEGGVLNTEIDVHGRLVAEQETGTSTHKIGVMQNCTGAGNSDPTNRNNCWGASVVSAPGSPDYLALYNNYNVLYTNHSYGTGTVPSGSYNSTARDHDLRIASLPNHLVVYSSGNSGDQTGYAPYDFTTWATITGGMKMNKNMLSIGALSPDDLLTSFSSRGPMYDGRIIPQLVIEGNEGTSFAAPKTTGILAMLQQAYKSINSGAVAPSSLLRAVLMNTADDIDNAGPDFRTGYGRINARRAYNMINEARFLTASISNAGTNSHTITVPANTKQVRVMIVWPDAAAAVNANPGIVNDLNLVAKDPSNVSYNPWVLDASLPSSTTKLNTPAVRGTDNLNTVEQVTVDNPQSGDWTIQVNGNNVPSGPQTYFLTYEFLPDELQFLFPLKDHKLQTGQTYNLRWDSYGVSGSFILDYQIDGGNWINIVVGQSATSRVYTWVAPILTGIHTIKFRVKRGSLTAESDVNYIGPVPENFRITKVCSDVVTLKWSPVTSATSYKVYRLGTTYMEQVTSGITITGNTAVLTGQSTTGSEYYAVSAVTGSYEGQKTLTIEKVAGDYGCTTVDWIGAVSTDWFTAGNWSTNEVPTSTDYVVIPSAPANQPFIAGNGAVCNNITIDNGASVSMHGSTAYTLSVSGDWVNNGTFTRGAGTVDFVGTNSYQEIAGNSTTAFNILKVTKGSIERILEATSLITLNAMIDPLVITSGTFKLSSASTITPFTSSADLGSGKGLWNNGGTINYGNISWFLNAGTFKLSAGTVNMGTNSNNSITYLNNGKFIIEGGTLNIAGRISPNSGTSSGTYSQYGGTVTVNAVGSTSTIRAPFELNSGVSFTMTGGTLAIPKASSNTSGDIMISSTTTNVSGGTLQIGNASTPTSQTIRLNCIAPVYNLTVNNTNNPVAQLLTNSLTIKNDVTISGGTLNANNLNLSVGGNWTNNGAFTAGTGTVTFNGGAGQSIAGSTATTFNNFTINNSAGLTLSGSVNATINGALSLTSGVISTGNNRVIMGSSGTVSRTSGHISGKLQKPVSIGSGIANTFEIGDASALNYTPASVVFSTVSTGGSLTASTNSNDHSDIGSSNLSASKSVNRFWTLTNSGIVFTSYNATFNFLASDLDQTASWNNLICGKYDIPTWTYPTIGTKTATSTQITNVSVFSDFQLAENNTPLPIELLSFNVIRDGDRVIIKWKTAAESNSDFFTVERSSDGYSFEPIGQIKGAGNSLSPNSYQHTDEQPLSGWLYYRIKQTDLSGAYTYTKIASLYFDSPSDRLFMLYPNPADEKEVTLVLNDAIQGALLQVFDASGKLVTTQTLADDVKQIKLSAIVRLPKGTCFVKVSTQDLSLNQTVRLLLN